MSLPAGTRRRTLEAFSAALPAAAVFLVGFLALPVRAMEGLGRFPGSMDDGRLNPYFLENVYQFLVGGSPSLWTLGIYSPYPYTLGFSDNLFGAAPVYVVARALGGEPYVAQMVWWYLAWAVNFAGSHYALRRLGLGRFGAVVGATLYTFALPVTSVSGWPQFSYRFGVPLAVAAFVLFLRRQRWRELVMAGLWTVWQFYCSIYLGVFTLVILTAVLAGHVVATAVTAGRRGLGAQIKALFRRLRELGGRSAVGLGAGLVALAAAMVLLLWPYLQVTMLYKITRSLDEIQSMEPTLRSYLVNDHSWIWKHLSAQVGITERREEHQFFPGLAVVVLVTAGVVAGIRRRGRIVSTTWRRRLDPLVLTMLASLVLVFVVTLNYRGFSAWNLVAQLPLFSAIRAVARINLVMLVPAAYLAGRGMDALWARGTVRRGLAVLCLTALLVEGVAVDPVSMPVRAWRQADAAVPEIPADLAAGSVIFVAQDPAGAPHASEVSVMWRALERGVPTLNGYSGGYPPGFVLEFGGDCTELPRRVKLYVEFLGKKGDAEAYRSVMATMVPLGFTSCQRSWWAAPPTVTMSGPGVSSAQLGALTLSRSTRTPTAVKGQGVVEVRLANGSGSPVPAGGAVPLALTYEFRDAGGAVLGLPAEARIAFDIAPGDVATVALGLDADRMVPGGSIVVAVATAGTGASPLTGSNTLSIPVS